LIKKSSKAHVKVLADYLNQEAIRAGSRRGSEINTQRSHFLRLNRIRYIDR